MTTLVVIPARWGSTRLPGKPLLPIAGRTLLHRVIDIAARSIDGRDASVIVASEDQRVVDHAEEAGCRAILTDPALPSGSDRALAAADAVAAADGEAASGDRIVNLQGDAPFIAAATVRAVIDAVAALPFGCVTPVVRLDWPDLDALRDRKRAAPFSGTTCVRDAAGRALWFSKAVLPMIRDEAAMRRRSAPSPVHQHIGLYGYTRAALRDFCAAAPSPLEQLEGLEQLRLLELGIPVQTISVARAAIQMSGIDTAQDVAIAEQLIARFGDPYGVAGD